MSDERHDWLERQLREWLSAEARRAVPPANLRHHAAAARETAVRGPRHAGWSLRPIVLTGATLALALLVGLAVAFSGLLPVGRADCSGVTIDAVKAAVADVPGYRWRMTGSELVGNPQFDTTASPPSVTYTYRTADLEFAGIYQAPDAWRVDLLAGYDDADFRQASVGGFLNSGWDAYLFVDGRAWARRRGGIHFEPVPGEDNVQEAREANQLYGLLFGLPFRLIPPTGEPTMAPLTWAVTSETDGCLLTAHDATYDQFAGAPSPQAAWSLTVLVEPKTLLPRRAEHALSSAETPLVERASSPRSDLDLVFTYDYENPPAVTSPVPAGFQPVDPQQAIADAWELGVGDAPTSETYQLGSAQVFVLHSPGATAALLYVDGRLQQSATVQSDLDVWVTLLGSGEPDPATFLVAVINNPRVASVEVYFTGGASLTLFGGGLHPQSVSSGEGLGDIVTWVAYDEGGNEISVEPPPP